MLHPMRIIDRNKNATIMGCDKKVNDDDSGKLHCSHKMRTKTKIYHKNVSYQVSSQERLRRPS